MTDMTAGVHGSSAIPPRQGCCHTSHQPAPSGSSPPWTRHCNASVKRRRQESPRAEPQSTCSEEGARSSRLAMDLPMAMQAGGRSHRSAPRPQQPGSPGLAEQPRLLGQAQALRLREEGCPGSAARPSRAARRPAPHCGLPAYVRRRHRRVPPPCGHRRFKAAERAGESRRPGSSEDTAPVLRNPRAAGTSSSRYRS
ncbi:uncharacterized protein C10orf95-like [Apus apus]|uniref:uncharacterized protein C10orf95-like n=1 Tax=Apus apus TaxID=8895 RepID=UPI0021F85358|nr:uncharacterized protein C10orf95-like [Apus apus]